MKKILIFAFLLVFSITLFATERKAKYKFRENGKYGILDNNGKVMIPAEYEIIGWLKYGIIPAVKDNYFVFIKENGEIIDKKFCSLWSDAPFKKAEHELIPVQDCKSEKWGVIDNKGNYIVKPLYDKTYHSANDIVMAVKDSHSYYFDIIGNLLFSFSNVKKAYYFRNGYAKIEFNNKEEIFYVDVKGHLFKEKPEDFKEEENIFADTMNSPYKIVNQCNMTVGIGSSSFSGANILPAKYDSVNYFSDDSFVIKKDKETFVFFPPSEAHSFSIFEKLDEGVDLINVFFGKGRIFIKTDHGKYSIVNNGKEITSERYENLIPLNYGMFIAVKNGKYGLVSADGKEITKFKYDKIEDKGNEYPIKTYLNGKIGFIDEKGKEIIPFEYDYACDFLGGETYLLKDNLEYVIDKNGKTILKTKPLEMKQNLTGGRMFSIFNLKHNEDPCTAGVDGWDHDSWGNIWHYIYEKNKKKQSIKNK